MNLTHTQLHTALGIMGISEDDLSNVRTSRSVSEMETVLTNFKSKVTKAYKLTVLDLHPDRNSEDLTDIFDLVTKAYNEIKTWKVRQVEPENKIRVSIRL